MAQVKEKTPGSAVIYKDFSLSMASHPATKDLAVVTNEEAIKRSLKHLILSNFYDNKFQPYIGSNVRYLLFEPVTPATGFILKNYIVSVIRNFEPRVNLIDVFVSFSSDDTVMNVRIVFELQNQQKEILFNIELERLR